ncbi:MAG TPA: hypothetical protein VF131_24695 [Blastocatellia bacterium]|nr:hypothetical protein [Blastocatellia bacterium]
MSSVPEKVRVTYVITKTVDMNVEALAAIEGMPKNEFIESAIKQTLLDKGVDPIKPPKENFLLSNPQKS